MAQYEITNRPVPIGFENSDDPVQRTIQNAKNLLMCRMGEVPYDRYRGFDAALYDVPIPELREVLVEEIDRVMLWEPDVEVVDADCNMDENGDILIRAVIEIAFA